MGRLHWKEEGLQMAWNRVTRKVIRLADMKPGELFTLESDCFGPDCVIDDRTCTSHGDFVQFWYNHKSAMHGEKRTYHKTCKVIPEKFERVWRRILKARREKAVHGA